MLSSSFLIVILSRAECRYAECRYPECRGAAFNSLAHALDKGEPPIDKLFFP